MRCHKNNQGGRGGLWIKRLFACSGINHYHHHRNDDNSNYHNLMDEDELALSEQSSPLMVDHADAGTHDPQSLNNYPRHVSNNGAVTMARRRRSGSSRTTTGSSSPPIVTKSPYTRLSSSSGSNGHKTWVRYVCDGIRKNDPSYCKENNKLDLKGRSIGPDDAILLAYALQKNQTIHEIDLGWNNIDADSIRYLVDALAVNTTIQRLDFSGNPLGANGAIALANGLRVNINTTLTHLDLGWTELSTMSAMFAIASLLRTNPSITSLSLNGNKIGLDGFLALQLSESSSITSTTPTTTNNSTTTTTTLKSLYLSWNEMGNNGAIAIADTLLIHNRSMHLRELNLKMNKIGPKGAIAICNALQKNTTLQWLDISGNAIGLKGLKRFAIVLQHDNTTLLKLVVSDTLGAILSDDDEMENDEDDHNDEIMENDGDFNTDNENDIMDISTMGLYTTLSFDEDIAPLASTPLKQMEQCTKMIRFYLRLNQAGRGNFWHYTQSISDETGRTTAVRRNPQQQWLECLIKINDDLDCIAYLVFLNPSLWLPLVI